MTAGERDMENKVATIAATPDPSFGQPPARSVAPATSAPAERQTQAPDQADLRLVIEEDSASGSYVYKTVNRRTGEVVQQYPREQLLKMRDENEYSAGDVIRARV